MKSAILANSFSRSVASSGRLLTRPFFFVKEPLLRLGQFPFGIHTPQRFQGLGKGRVPDAVVIDVFVFVHFVLPRF